MSTKWSIQESRWIDNEEKFQKLIHAAEQFLTMYDTQIPSEKQIEELAEEMRSGLEEARS